MKKILQLILISGLVSQLYAGNPDRQGEAGAYELLLNPWARSAGLFSMTTANAKGVDALFMNPAGVGRIEGLEIGLAHSRLFAGSGISLSSFGLCTKIGKKGGFLGIAINAVNFGNISVTTNDFPEGNGATFSPSFVNVGLSYGFTFENKISVGFQLKGISESVVDVSAFGVSLDAGVQYVTGHKDEFKLGIVLKNIGTPMRFGGQGLNVNQKNPNNEFDYKLTYNYNAAKFELPSQLLIGASYDIAIDKKSKLTVVGNFTSNAFSRDQIGGGVEFSFMNMVTLRGGYKYEMGRLAAEAQLHSGVCGGLSVDVPMKKDSDKKLGIDYAYLTSSPFGGTHSLSLRIGL